jgi:hypothetical protein
MASAKRKMEKGKSKKHGLRAVKPGGLSRGEILVLAINLLSLEPKTSVKSGDILLPCSST